MENGALRPTGKTKKTKTCSTSNSSNNNSSRGNSNKAKKWVAKTLKQHRGSLLKELDVNKVLPHLVYHRVFSLGEYKEILGHQSQAKQAEVFLDKLSSKGPTAFSAFCSVLEEVNPHLLTCLLLDHEDSEMVKVFCRSQRCEGGRAMPLPRQSQSLPRQQDLSHVPLFWNHPLLQNR
ncbi:hypothetical protein ACEWY4_026639 [Coilia grayii]|uniref:CARD domain-containing protein n=1 Tax=Coilia grayii TaxID=363190 RepID=A0ABD1IQ47_9TELE